MNSHKPSLNPSPGNATLLSSHQVPSFSNKQEKLIVAGVNQYIAIIALKTG